MMEYISRDFALDVVKRTSGDYAAAFAEIAHAPAADVAPVVRCRECKHLNVVNNEKLYAHCPKTNTVFLPFQIDTRTHFCSLGERH